MAEADTAGPDLVHGQIERWLHWYVDQASDAEFLVVSVPDGWYVQWLLEDDGSLHTEVSSLIGQTGHDASAADLLLPGPQHQALVGAGFAPPDGQIPNYWKRWPVDWSTVEVAAEAAWVLERVFDQGSACDLEATAAILVP